LRPAVILADAERGDWVLCQITSKPYADARAVEIAGEDFLEGGLRVVSYARPGKLFTAHHRLFHDSTGILQAEALNRVLDAVTAMLRKHRTP
jgi:mRNA interferase MazF